MESSLKSDSDHMTDVPLDANARDDPIRVPGVLDRDPVSAGALASCLESRAATWAQRIDERPVLDDPTRSSKRHLRNGVSDFYHDGRDELSCAADRVVVGARGKKGESTE